MATTRARAPPRRTPRPIGRFTNEEENMKEVFTKYGPGTHREEENSACVVSHPDAGGECNRPTIGEVWSLPFCELHGREAELAAREEMATSLEGIFNGLVAVEHQRHDHNKIAVEILKAPAGSAYTHLSADDMRAHEAAMLAAYPPDELEGNTDADT